MAQVSLQVNGYGYILGCADGEEAHLLALAADLDKRIDAIKESTGPTAEARMLLMAALVLADDLHDLRKQTDQPDGAGASAAKPAQKANRRLRSLVKRAEDLADLAEAPSGAPPEAPSGAPPEAASRDAENVAARPEQA
ncbi:MAG: cell division protein ZapA [Acetobacteraceae bacterium]|nr:cell division protein ZapA [Acetobacteraceae bacterium]